MHSERHDRLLSPMNVETGSPTELGACTCASLAGQFSGEIPLSLPPDVGIAAGLPHLPGIYRRAGDLNWGPLLVQQMF